ncbi:MAG: glycosyltransferase family 2 protein [Bacteroidia bacterium]
MAKPVIAVVILNYNGTKLLRQFLPSVMDHSQGSSVYVIDNASTDDSVNVLQSEFPSVKIISNRENLGFAEGYNIGLNQIVADYFVLLNSDVEVTENWLMPVIEVMEADKNIAACQPKILSYNNKDEFEYAGACGGFIDKYGYPFCRGRMFNELEKDAGQYNEVLEIFWATGACMFVRAEVYNELRGFDNKYFAHMEEVDLCWRMKNLGHKIMAVPSSVVYHLGGGTLNKISPKKTYLNFRNNLITVTKNYPSAIWIWVIVVRLFLDGIAGVKFLFEGKPRHMFAIIYAHFAYYFYLIRSITKRVKMKKREGYRPNLRRMYNGSIVADHFLRKVKTFSQLDKNRFL